MFDGALTRYCLPETKFADLWTVLTMDQHYNGCWHTSQRRVDNLGDNFISWIVRHNPCDDVELYSRLPVGRDSHYSKVPHAYFRFDRSLLRLQTTRRVDSKYERSRSTDRQISPVTFTPTRANATVETSIADAERGTGSSTIQRHRIHLPWPSETSTVDVDERSRTPDETRSTPIEVKIKQRYLALRPLNILRSPTKSTTMRWSDGTMRRTDSAMQRTDGAMRRTDGTM
ncbi:hypothetical protein LSAT2_025620 [Lamellibrachia satsuma]|nr:hypothetical protein LSAT2_025620 [Lamellibrachia satsuma]